MLKFRNKKSWYVIGIMSGTSLDGVDLVYCLLEKKREWKYRIIQAKTYSYTKKQKEKIKEIYLTKGKILQKESLSFGKHLGQLVLKFKKEFSIKKIDCISSHGHTVFHDPKKRLTFQIGDGQVIADITKKTTVCDFRRQDIALGGEGAPLVPVGDELLFSEFEFCLNLGGFANVSFPFKGKRQAFDICPCNIVLNHIANKLNKEFDKDGELSKQGIINKKLLRDLNKLEFYKKEGPKSLGLEWVKTEFGLVLSKHKETEINKLRTLVEHIATQVAIHIKGNTLLTGGGEKNKFLLERIQKTSGYKIKKASILLVDFKEALVFSLLGILRLRKEANVFSSVTGAKKDHSSGSVFYPKN